MQIVVGMLPCMPMKNTTKQTLAELADALESCKVELMVTTEDDIKAARLNKREKAALRVFRMFVNPKFQPEIATDCLHLALNTDRHGEMTEWVESALSYLE